MKRILITFFSLFLTTMLACAQEKSYQTAIIGFYNLENLFDTIDSPDTDDLEFTPQGSSQWNTVRLNHKLKQITEVVMQLGDEYSKEGPAIVGLSEIENRSAVELLLKDPYLKGYGLVHYESPDRRGIDVAMVYKQSRFTVTASKPMHVFNPADTGWRTRDVLLVEGKLDGERIWIMVNHWPSRRGGEQQSAPLRALAASVCRHAADSVTAIQPGAKIIIMGDLNDDPTDESVEKVLRAKGKKEKLAPGDLYDPMTLLFKEGVGSLAYRDAWNLFDQIIVSQGLLDKNNKGYSFYKASVFNRKFLVQKEGQYAGYPYRTYAGGVYQGGYSDHFPVYVVLLKEKK